MVCSNADRLPVMQVQVFRLQWRRRRRFGGRWNPVGVPAIYLAQTRALCILERLVHLVRLPHDEAFTRVYIPPGMPTVNLKRRDLPPGWDDPVESSKTQQMGAGLIQQGVAVLKVPSIIVPGEWCFVLNPESENFAQIKFGQPVPHKYDRRLRY